MMQTKKQAFLFMLGWAISFVIAMSLNKGLDSSIPTEMIVFYRLIFALFWLAPYLYKKNKTVFKSVVLKWHILRALVTSLTIGCTYYSYRNLPLAIATSIGLSGPLFTTLLASIFLKEKLTLKKISLIFIGYIGVLCVVTTDIIILLQSFLESIFIKKTFFSRVLDPSFFYFEETILIAILGNILMGIVLILLKKVTKHDEPTTVLFYNTFLTTVFVGIYALPSFYFPGFGNIGFLILIGILGLTLQFCYTKAMSLEDASFVAPLEYMRIVIAIPIGILFFNESISVQTSLGILLILGSTYMLTKNT